MTEHIAEMTGRGKRFAIIVTRWNELITKQLLEGALDELSRHGAEASEVVHVPGSWEMPIVARTLTERKVADRPSAIIAIGCILQGATTHAQLLAGDVSSALMRLQLETGVPIAWGILTPETQEQGLERAGLKMGNKGREAALAAIEMASLVEKIKPS